MDINKFKKAYLKYMNEDEEIYDDLIYAVQDLSKVKDFDVIEFYECLNELIVEVSDNELFQMIRILPMNKPKYLFGVLLYLLKDLNSNRDLNEKIEYLNKFVDYKIDIFRIVNYLSEF